MPSRTKDEILQDLTSIFAQVLREDVRLTRETSAPDVDGWDSLAHISLMLAVEEFFGVKLGLKELERTRNVGDLVDLLAAKQ